MKRKTHWIRFDDGDNSWTLCGIGPIGERPKVLYWEGHDSPEIDCKSCLRSITEFELIYMRDELPAGL